MLIASAKGLVLIAIGVVIGALVPDGLTSIATPLCADIYSGGKPVVYSLQQLWQHAPTPEPGLSHLTVTGFVVYSCANFGLFKIESARRCLIVSRNGAKHCILCSCPGRVHHGVKNFEVWRQTLAAGVSTPIHSHDCEELNLVLQGSGTLYLRSKTGTVDEVHVGVNDSVLAPPNAIYQMVNEGPDDLTLMVVMGCAPAHIDVYQSFESESSSASRIYPMPWDVSCPPSVPPGFASLVQQRGSTTTQA